MRRIHREWLSNIGCCAVLAALAALVYYPALIDGKIPLTVDSIYLEPPWEDARPADFDEGLAQRFEAAATKFVPWYAFISESAARGDSVLWNPYEGAGVPFLAAWRTRCLSPFTLPFYVLPLFAAVRISLLLKVITAGITAYAAGRRLGFHAPLALMLGISYQLSAPMLLWTAWPIGDAAPWLPLFIVAVDRISVGRRDFWPFAAVPLGLMLLGGAPETALATAVLGVLFAWIRMELRRDSRIDKARNFAAIAVVLAAGVNIAAAQILPFIEFVAHSAPETSQIAPYSFTGTDLVALFFPGIQVNGGKHGIEYRALLHPGFLSLCLLPLWFATRPFLVPEQRRRGEALLGATAVLVCAAVFLGYFRPEGACGRWFGPEHLLLAMPFTGAFLGAAAVEEWLHLDAAECKSALRRLAGGIAVVAALFVAFWGAAAVVDAEIPVWQLVALVAVCACALAALGVTLLRPSVTLAGVSMSVLSAAALILVFRGYVPFQDPERFYPETEFIAAIKRQDGRLGGLVSESWPLAGNLAPQLGVASGLELQRRALYMYRVEDAPALIRRAGIAALLLTREDIQGNFAPLRQTLHIEEVFPTGALLLTDAENLPRARLEHEARPSEGPRADLLAADELPLIETSQGFTPSMEASVALNIKGGERNTEVVIDTAGKGAGIAVLADAWFPGWEADADGKSVEVFPVDVLFRGVIIPEGTGRVTFRYRSRWLAAGLVISATASLVCLIGMVQYTRKWLQRR